MIYICAKCRFLFERKNEPSKCPSCENQCIVEASSSEQQSYKSNSGFGHGLSTDYVTSAFNAAVQNDVSANQQKGPPIAKYDAVKKRTYFELPDGTKEYINGS